MRLGRFASPSAIALFCWASGCSGDGGDPESDTSFDASTDTPTDAGDGSGVDASDVAVDPTGDPELEAEADLVEVTEVVDEPDVVIDTDVVQEVEVEVDVPDLGPDLGPAPNLGDLRVVGGLDLAALRRWDIALSELDFSGLTHLMVGFLSLDEDGTCRLGEEADGARYRALVVDGGPRVIVSVGGFGMGSQHFSVVAADEVRRARFAETCAAVVADLGAAGLDVSWETPILGGIYGPGNAADWANYVELLTATRAGLDAAADAASLDRLELSFFGPGDLFVVPPASLAAAVGVVDTAATLSFDFAGTWERTTGLASSLFAPSGYSVDLVVSAWRETGADVSKLLIGVPLYGWGWAGVGSISDGLFQPSSGAAPGSTGDPGLYDYGALEPIPTGYERFFDETRQVPWLYSADDQIFITLEDRVSMQAKANFVIDEGLGGVLGWQMALDPSGTLLPVAATVFEAAAE